MALRTGLMMIAVVLCVIGLAWVLGEQERDPAPTPHVWVNAPSVPRGPAEPGLATAPAPAEAAPRAHEPRGRVPSWLLGGEFSHEQFVQWIHEHPRNVDAFVDLLVGKRKGRASEYLFNEGRKIFAFGGFDAGKVMPRVRTRLRLPATEPAELSVLLGITAGLGAHDGAALDELATAVASAKTPRRLRESVAAALLGTPVSSRHVRVVESFMRELATGHPLELGGIFQALRRNKEHARPFVPILLELWPKAKGWGEIHVLDVVAHANPDHPGARAFYIHCADHREAGVRRKAVGALVSADPEGVDELVAHLESASVRSRVRGASVLLELGVARERVPGLLLSALAEGRPVERDRAVTLLAGVAPDPKRALPIVRELFASKDRTRWVSGTKALGALTTGIGARDDIMQLLFVAARLPDAKVRVLAVQSLLMYDGHAEQVVKLLADLLADTEPYVRREAVDGLGEMASRDAAARGHLRAALSDADEGVRKLAAYWLKLEDDE